jgi:hypothetical protein
MLSGCYITLFGPRNEFLSFVVLTPALAMLAGLMLMRNDADGRGWLLILAALLLGFTFDYHDVDGVLKPAIVLAIYVWLGWLMAVPARWCGIVEGDDTLRAKASEPAMAGVAAGNR